jgi:hypothetical protein
MPIDDALEQLPESPKINMVPIKIAIYSDFYDHHIKVDGEEYNVITNLHDDTTHGTIDYLKNRLLEMEGHKVSALELKYGFTKDDEGFHYSTYIFVDVTKKDFIFLPNAFAKGYAGEGSRGALTLDNYITLLDIPIKRTRVSDETIDIRKIDDLNNIPEEELEMPGASIMLYQAPDSKTIVKLMKRIEDRFFQGHVHAYNRTYDLSNVTSLSDALDQAEFN